jgi:Outer membrane protein beta-barrel domain
VARQDRARTIASSICVAVVIALHPTSAAAQGEAHADPLQFCRDHWFAMGPCRERAWTGPELELGLAVGVAAMVESGPFGFGNGVGSVTSAGPAWSLVAGVELLPWLALEGRYLGTYDSASASVSSSGGFLTSAGTVVVRLTAPLPFVHPYVFGGIGYYDIGFTGPSASVLHSSSQAGIPMGIGVDVPLNYHLSVGVEASYNFQLNESYSNVTTNGIDGGDITRFDLIWRARL